ncbi:MAG: hypothetical protein RLZZ350_16 [Verrucomicrobiota bacterium]|jgi:hypothetical protein
MEAVIGTLFLILFVIAIAAPVIAVWYVGYVRPQIQAEEREFLRRVTFFNSRPPLSSVSFCELAHLPPEDVVLVDTFRQFFAEEMSRKVTITADKIYPEDDACTAFQWDDDMAMFLTSKGLLTNPDYEYSFPLEQVSCFTDLIKMTKQLNAEKQ